MTGWEWFAPKRYGYGSGLPIAWQGWALLSGYIALVVGVGVAFEDKPALATAIFFPATILLFVITAKTTRGGWRWRWGDKD